MSRRVFALALLGVTIAACKPSGATPAQAEVTEAPVPAPTTLIAEATLRDPDSLWSALRSGGGDALGTLPDTAAGVVVARAGLELRFARLVMGGLPFHLALGEASRGGVAFAIAMKVRDVHAAEQTLTKGDTGRYVGRPLYGMTVLASRSDRALPVAVALAPSGYLVLASTEEDLGTFGAYVVRTLPVQPPAPSAFEVRFAPAALTQTSEKATNLAAMITSLALHGAASSLPPWLDANALAICVNPMLVEGVGTIGDLAQAKVEIDTGNGELHAVATLAPKPGDNAARRLISALHPADASPLLDTPRDALLAWFTSDAPDQRAEGAATLGPCVDQALARALGPGGERVGRGMAGWAKGRGDWDTVTLLSLTPARGIAIRAPVLDPEAVAKSLSDSTTVASRLGLAVGKNDDAHEVFVGVGLSPKEILDAARRPPTLGSDGPSARAVRALEANASFAAVLRPPGCCRTGTATADPVTFAWGRKDDLGWLRVEVGYEIVARFAGSALLK